MAISQANSVLKRLFSSLPPKNVLQPLTKRSIIEVKGPDAAEFLQGLITNDIHHISSGVGSMFTMFLNNKGRILYDALIYKTEENDLYMIECDTQVLPSLQRHLSLYKVKRKVNVTSLDSYKIHVLYNTSFLDYKNRQPHTLTGEYDSKQLPESSSGFKMYNGMMIFKDPRVTQLGFRIIAKHDESVQKAVNKIVDCGNGNSYRRLRYSLGIGEGTEDLPVGNSFPLECNCDYLHGVSFQKGCYIGQELTARTYHTGVIRKRLMPLVFSKMPNNLPENNVIVHNKTNLGKLRGVEDNIGLALLRISQALEYGKIVVGDGEATVVKPRWWPVEMPKEKCNVHTT